MRGEAGGIITLGIFNMHSKLVLNGKYVWNVWLMCAGEDVKDIILMFGGGFAGK